MAVSTIFDFDFKFIETCTASYEIKHVRSICVRVLEKVRGTALSTFISKGGYHVPSFPPVEAHQLAS